jgi:predicted nucleotidyltransferase
MSTATQPVWAVTPEKIGEAVRRIVEASHPAKIIMFGSRARGQGRTDSDLDLVVIERGAPDRFAEIVRLHRALRGLILGVDILVIGEKDFEEWSDTPGSVYHSARREGKVLYEEA